MRDILKSYFEKDDSLKEFIQSESRITEIVGEEDTGKTLLSLYLSEQLEKNSIVFYHTYDKKITESYFTNKNLNYVLSFEAGVDQLSTSLLRLFKEVDMIIIDGFPFCDNPKKLLDVLQIIKERSENLPILLVNQLRYSEKKDKTVSFYEKYINRIIDYRIFLSKEGRYIEAQKIRSRLQLEKNLQYLSDVL